MRANEIPAKVIQCFQKKLKRLMQTDVERTLFSEQTDSANKLALMIFTACDECQSTATSETVLGLPCK